MIAYGQKFENITIFLDGSSFYNCQFTNCNLVFSGVVGFLMDKPVYQGCAWTPQGPALQTIQLLSNLYKTGAVDLIEAIFKNIKGEGLQAPFPSQTPPPVPAETSPPMPDPDKSIF